MSKNTNFEYENITKKNMSGGIKLKKINKFDKFSTILLYIQKKYGILYVGLEGNFG